MTGVWASRILSPLFLCAALLTPAEAVDSKTAPATICRGSTSPQQVELFYDNDGSVVAADLAGVVCPLVTDSVTNGNGLSEAKLWVDPVDTSALTCSIACMNATGTEQENTNDTTSGTGHQVLDFGAFDLDCVSHGTYVISCVMDAGDRLHAIRWEEN